MRAQGFTVTRLENERGIALITTLLVMMLMSALLVGFTTVVMSDQRYRLIDRDRVRSFYAAHSGLEKLNVDLANLFLTNVAPSTTQLNALAEDPPEIDDVDFIDTGDAKYGVKLESTPEPSPISTGPYQGLVALKKIYRLDATARTADGGETHLMRRVETVTIPVFQFGVFSDVDLSFHAGADFNFGGRVHSNRDLYLAQGGGSGIKLTLPDRVTAVRDVIRKTLANGQSITTTGHTNTVSLATAPGAFRALADTEGSVTGGAGSGANPLWSTISLSTYNGYIRNTATGARRLDLPLLTTGGTNADLIRRPTNGESQELLESRYFNNVSLRILLSDKASDITGLPTVTATPPVELKNEWRTTPPNNGVAYGPVDATHNPIAESPGRILTGGVAPTVSAAVAISGTATINVNTFPAAFRLPASGLPNSGFLLRVFKSGASGSPWFVTCSGRDTTTLEFTGCVSPTLPTAAVTVGSSPNQLRVEAVTLDGNNVTPQLAGATWGTGSPLNFSRIRMANLAALNSFSPNLFAVTIRKNTSTYRALCSGKNQTQFLGCVADPTATSGAPTSAVTITSPAATYDIAYTTPSDGNQTATNQALGANWNWTSSTTAPTTITVGNTGGTMQYTTNTFWVMNANGSNVLVTCTGFQIASTPTVAPATTTPHQLTGCNVTTALQANAPIESGALSNANTGLIGGFIKVERQNAAKQWTDVTMEFLNYGISGPNLNGGRICNPSPNAIIQLQRLRDNAESGTGTCSYSGTLLSSDFVPNVIYDTREAVYRDEGPGDTRLFLGGVMHYISINAANLSDWFEGTGAYTGGTGTQTLKDNGGWSVYISDRRNNRDSANRETGEFGFEDIINPATINANGTLETGEDVNGNNVLETYGNMPNYEGNSNASFPGAVAPMTNAARLNTLVRGPYALHNRALFFRRAVKLINGGVGNLPAAGGLTIASEGPVYIHGSWNANSADANGLAQGSPSVATSLVADSVTLLSDNWSDLNSIRSPYDLSARNRSAASYYRLAIIAGKNMAFPYPGGDPAPPTDFGTDGGIHNFLRMLEQGGTVHYRGSIATFFYSRQATGVYKCCDTVYGAPARKFAFDTNFLDPAKLPPLTPMFRDTNSLGFAQEVRPGK